jgi:hypothetical protein
MLADFLEHGRLLAAADGVVQIGFAPADTFFLETAGEQENLLCLRAAARELLGGRGEVRLVTLDGEGAGIAPATPAHQETDRHRRLRHEALDAPALGWAMDVLQAQVVDVKLDE